MHPIDDKQVDLGIGHNASESELYYRTISNVHFDESQFQDNPGKDMVIGRFELRELDQVYSDDGQWEPLVEHFRARNASSETLENYLLNRTDLRNQINYYLFALLAQATDNNYKNHNYISKFDNGTRIMLESPWDLDLT